MSGAEDSEDDRTTGDLWVFGYGSLVWRPSFPFVERRAARVRGWTRRFWQGSTDHRGVPGAPGRVVTLLREAEAICWGVAYRLAAEQMDEVMAHLDWREKGGYQRVDEQLELLSPSATARGVIYVATEANPNYLGPASLETIAAQVMRSEGPSGPNPEYVLRLAEALRAMRAEDPHVFALEALLRS